MASQWVKGFAPSWFASVMGTGVLVLTTETMSRKLPSLAPLALGLHWFNIALFVVLLVPWLLRWFVAREAAVAALSHPVTASFMPTVSIALLVLVNQFVLFGPSAWALGAWWIGTVATVVFSIVILYRQFVGEYVTLDHITPGMFIPPVGLVVVPLAGSALVRQLGAGEGASVLAVSYACLGAGTMLYIGLLAVTLFRYVLHKPVPGQMTPTAWINLGPVGVIALDLIVLSEASPFLTGTEGVMRFFALLLWGFGAWWLTMALVMTVARFRTRELPFSLAWWAFTFPLGAYAAASFKIGALTGLPLVGGVGTFAYVLLAVLWTATLILTLRGVASGAIFRAH